MQITGYCRFSYFGVSDTGKAVQTEDDAQQMLYNEDRMAARFHLFENLTAPSILHQTDPDFRFVVITSTILPDRYKARLKAIVASVPQMQLVVTDKCDLAKVLRPMIKASGASGLLPTLSFRLDDDDAVSINYIARLRALSERLEPNTIICFPKGFLAFTDGVGKFGETFREYHACGFARYNRAGDFRDPFTLQHKQEYKRLASYMDPGFHGYIYAAHGHNNTKVGLGADTGMIARYLRNNPDLAAATSLAPAEVALRKGFPFLTPERLKAVVFDSVSVGFDPARALPESLRLREAATY